MDIPRVSPVKSPQSPLLQRPQKITQSELAQKGGILYLVHSTDIEKLPSILSEGALLRGMDVKSAPTGVGTGSNRFGFIHQN